jgi:Zn-dependent M28 family amino/carboxypeptidase
VPEIEGLTTTQTGATDHVSFRDVGFAAVGLTEEYVSGDTTPHYHLPSDTYDTVDLDYLRVASTLVNAAFANAIAGE